jgi:hypothetical protein
MRTPKMKLTSIALLLAASLIQTQAIVPARAADVVAETVKAVPLKLGCAMVQLILPK